MRQKFEERDSPIFTRRAAVLGIGQVSLFALLAGRLQYLQVTQSQEYAMLAEENRVNIGILAPSRGRIFDRFGQELATNKPNFQVVMIPEQTDDPLQTLEAVNRLVPIAPSKRRRLADGIKRSRSFVPFTLVENLTWDEFSAINVHSPHLAGVEPRVGEMRYYPKSEEFAHIVGYVGVPNPDDLIDNNPLFRVPGFRLGRSGIEQDLDEKLRGLAGTRRVEVNNVGRIIRELARDSGSTGADIVLTLDRHLQQYAQKQLGDKSGAVVVMDVHSGDVLAMTSSPSFDPNDFNLGISQRKWDDLLDDERAPLLNKAIAGQYAPGSTFKMLVALAGLEQGVITLDEEITCTGQYEIGTDIFHCWKEDGHGAVNMHEAIKHSCDVYFYELSKRLGIDPITEIAERFGFGTVTGLETKGEKSGNVPSKDWKRATLDAGWQTGETLITGIGQGYLLATPIQLAVMASRLANGRQKVMPSLLYAVNDEVKLRPEFEPLTLNETHLEIIQNAMAAVTNEADGTAYMPDFKGAGQKMAGKTGTVQVRRITADEREAGIIDNKDLAWRLRDHALFIGHAPLNNPKYAVVVVVEHGGSGSKIAAPIGRKVMEEALKTDPLSRDVYLPPQRKESAR